MKCLCKLDIQVLEFHDLCPVHKLADRKNYFHALALDRQATIERYQAERENILSALGEHPESDTNIAQRVSDIRDEGRAHFHNFTKSQERLRATVKASEAVVAERNAFWKFYTDELKKTEEYEASFKLRHAADMRAIKRWQEATGRTQVWPDHADLVVWLMEQLYEAVSLIDDAAAHGVILAKLIPFLVRYKRRGETKTEDQPMALNCTLCGSTIHTDSFHSERCPNGYR